MTTIVTFRLDTGIIESLKRHAQQQGISLNALVNHILSKFVRWDMYEKKAGMIPLPRPLLMKIFDMLDDEEIAELATWMGKSIIPEIILFMEGNINKDSIITWLEKRLSDVFEMRHVSDPNNNNDIIIIKHDLGKKWSLFHKILFTTIFNELLDVRVNVKFDNNIILLSLYWR